MATSSTASKTSVLPRASREGKALKFKIVKSKLFEPCDYSGRQDQLKGKFLHQVPQHQGFELFEEKREYSEDFVQNNLENN